MSEKDYLWDGSGDRDDELAHLERTLGSHRSAGSPRRPRLALWAVLTIGLLTAAIGYWLLPLENVPEPVMGLIHDGPVDRIHILGGQRVEIEYEPGPQESTYFSNPNYPYHELRRRGLNPIVPNAGDYNHLESLPTSTTPPERATVELPGWNRARARAYVRGATHSGNWHVTRILRSPEIDDSLRQLAQRAPSDTWEWQLFVDDDLVNRSLAEPVSFQVDKWTIDDRAERTGGYLSSADETSLRRHLADWKSPCAPCKVIVSPILGGFRTYVVDDRPFLTPVGLAAALPAINDQAALELRVSHAPALGHVTRNHVGERIALVIDGRVVSTPVVRTAIDGGRFEIPVEVPAGLSQLPYLHGLSRAFAGRPLTSPISIRSIESIPPGASSAQVVLIRAVLPTALAIGVAILLFLGLRLSRPLDPELPRGRTGTVALAGRETINLLAIGAGLVASQTIRFDWDMESVFSWIGFGNLYSVAALGMLPYFLSVIAVEAVCLLIPKLRSWRHGAPQRRRRLSRIALLLTPVIATLLALDLVDAIPTDTSWTTVPIDWMLAEQAVTLLVLASTGFALVGAVVDRFGYGNGYLLTGLAVILGANWHQATQDLSASALATTVLTLGATAAALVLLLTARRRSGSSFQPMATAGVVPWIVVVLPAMAVGSLGLPRLFWTFPLMAGLVALATVGLSAAFRSEASTASAIKVRGANRASGFGSSVALSTLLMTVGFAAFIAVLPTHPQLLLLVAIATPMVLDVVVDWKAYLREPSLRTVWILRSPEDVELAIDALVSSEIDVHVANRYVHTALRWLGGFAPLKVMVPADFEDSAQEILRSL